jgi:hypothetical protein
MLILFRVRVWDDHVALYKNISNGILIVEKLGTASMMRPVKHQKSLKNTIFYSIIKIKGM